MTVKCPNITRAFVNNKALLAKLKDTEYLPQTHMDKVNLKMRHFVLKLYGQ